MLRVGPSVAAAVRGRGTCMGKMLPQQAPTQKMHTAAVCVMEWFSTVYGVG
jgi:hypothetical protein